MRWYSIRSMSLIVHRSIRCQPVNSAAVGYLWRYAGLRRCAVRCGSIMVVVTLISLAVAFGSIAPTAAHVQSEDESAQQSQEALDTLAEQFSDVLALRNTPDSTCLDVRIDEHTIFESKSRVGLVPASLMKIVTAAAALDVMSPKETYETKVFVRSDILSSVEDGILRGDIYLVGGGDPVLSTPRYIERFPEQIAYTDITKLSDRVGDALIAHGVTKVEGRIVGDDSWFPDGERDYAEQRLHEDSTPIWKRSFVDLNTVGQLSGLLLNDGYSSYARSTGTAGTRQNVRASEPTQNAASVFDDLLEAQGFVITRKPVSGLAPPPAERALLGSIKSPPLSEILIRMLSRSDNTTAEMLLKEIGRRTSESARSDAVASVTEIMQRLLGPSAEGLAIADGSGLSSHNRLTCAAVVDLLIQAGPGSPLIEGLAMTGERGTLRFCQPAVAGQNEHNAIRAKTGTLNQSTALAGVTVGANGEVLVFAMIANRPHIIGLGSCNSIRREVMNAVARYTYRDLSPNFSVHSGDRAALKAIFDATGGDAWVNVYRWNTDFPLNRWHGVTTNESGRVTGIDFGGPFGNGLVGMLPEELGDLDELVLLDLSNNDLSGSLPSSLSKLAKLNEFRLSGTNLCLSRGSQYQKSESGQTSKAQLPICTSFVDTFNTVYAEPIEALAENGVLDSSECSETHICPEDVIRRSTMAVWLIRSLYEDEPAAGGVTRFADVDAASWWAAHVERLAELGITVGCRRDPLRYCPERGVTRRQATVLLARALDLSPVEPVGFVDIPPDDARGQIGAVVAAGIIGACVADPAQLQYCPRDVVTRGEAAAFLTEARRILADRPK